MVSLVPSLNFLNSFVFLTFILQLAHRASGSTLKCMNDGRLTVKKNKSVCICPAPFIGRQCEDVSCVNGLSTGSQYNPRNVFFNKRCLCDPGWGGVLCDKSLIDRCGENGEEENGECVCQPNFVGPRCEYVTKCINGQLYNGRCACHYGWAGNFCNKIICHQGQADETNTACLCPPQYRGKYCDFCAEPSSSPPPECAKIDGRYTRINGDTLSIILALISTFILIILGCGLYLICKKMSQVKKESKNGRQTTIDIEVRISNHVGEARPLCDTSGNATTHAADAKKYNQAPPPYDAIGYNFQKETVKKEPQFDSAVASSTSSTQNNDQD